MSYITLPAVKDALATRDASQALLLNGLQGRIAATLPAAPGTLPWSVLVPSFKFPDSAPSATQTILLAATTVDDTANNIVFIHINTSGLFVIRVQSSTGNYIQASASIATYYGKTLPVYVGFAGAIPVLKVGTTQLVLSETPSGSAPAWSSSISARYLDAYAAGTAGLKYTGTAIVPHFLLGNLTDAEWSAYVATKRLPWWAMQQATGTAQTSGSLVVGKKYIIASYLGADSFTNVGAASNATGVIFTATGTTPTTWTSSTQLQLLGSVIFPDPAQLGTGAQWSDSSGNAAHYTFASPYPVWANPTTAAIQRKVLGLDTTDSPTFASETLTGDLLYNTSQSVASNLNSRAASGGLAFNSTSGQQGLVTLGATGAIGADPFSVSIYVQVPSVAPAAELSVFDFHNTLAYSDYAFRSRIVATTGALRVAIYGATASDYRYADVSSFVTTYAGKTVLLTYVRSSSGISVYCNGTPLTLGSETVSGSNPAWTASVLSTYFMVGAAAGLTNPYSRILDRPALFSRALTAADVTALVASGNIPASADQWGSQVAAYSSDFSAGVSGFGTSVTGVTTTGNVDGINGQDDWLSSQRTSTTGTVVAQRNCSAALGANLILNEYIEIKLRCYNGSATPRYLNVGFAGAYLAAQKVAISATSQADCTFAYIVTSSIVGAYTSDFRITVVLADGTTPDSTVPVGEIFCLKNVQLIRRGCITYHPLTEGIGTIASDASSNALHMALTSVGWANPSSGVLAARTIQSDGALTLAAGGTNQNVTLTPSGTGIVLANRYIEFLNGSGIFIRRAGDSSGTQQFWLDGTNKLNIGAGATTIDLLSGKGLIESNGAFSFATALTATAVNTGGLKSANYGFSTALGGAGFYGGPMTFGGTLTASADSGLTNVWTTSGSIGSALVFRQGRNTLASPTASQANDLLGGLGARGYGATGYATVSRASINYYAAENWTDSAQGTYVKIATTPIGSTTRADVINIADTGVVTIYAGTASTASNNGALVVTGGGGFGGSVNIAGLCTAQQNNAIQSTLTYAGSTAIDFAGDGVKTIAITGNITFTTSNKAAQRSVQLIISADASNRTFTFPVGWIWLGVTPTNILANKTGILSLYCKGTNETDVLAGWQTQL
jgi:hypothetical protein